MTHFFFNFFLLAFGLIFCSGCAEADEAPLPDLKSVQYRVEIVAENLEVPWAMAFASDNRLLFTERPGRVRVIENGKLQAAPLFIVTDVEPVGESGLMGIALHPNFAENRWLYLAYAYQADGKRVKVVRYRETGKDLIEPKIIIDNIPAAKFHAGTRLRFGPDGKLYITTGDGLNQSQGQNLTSLGGKTLRLNDDGTIPSDNPFVNQKEARPEIWTYGHRNAQGLDWQPETDLMFQSEHGPSLIDGVSLFKRSGGDEINIVERGKNYGWAEISHNMKRGGMETPLASYSPAIAPAGAIFYRGSLFSEFKSNFFVAALKKQAIIRLEIKDRKVVGQQILFEKEYGRIREIAEAPDGTIYFSTSNRDGRGEAKKEDDRILRIVPVK